MALGLPIVDAVAGLFSGLVGAIDEWHTSDEEKLLAKGKIFAAQAGLLATVFDYEKETLAMQATIITAEAQGESWIQRSWRPITMLTFVALVVARWMGYSAENVTPELEEDLMIKGNWCDLRKNLERRSSNGIYTKP